MTGVRLDLQELKQMHVRLPATTAAEYATHAAIALQRQGHAPICELGVDFHTDDSGSVAELNWEAVPLELADQLDRHRVTENGAEAVALAIVFGLPRVGNPSKTTERRIRGLAS